MNARPISRSLLPLAALALCGSIAIAQDTPAAPPTPAAPGTSAAPAAPIERHTPPPDMRNRPNFQRGMMHNRGEDPMGGRGPMGGGGAFHIAPEGMWWKNPRVVERLTLTPDQVKRMDGIFQQSRLQLIDLHADVEKQEVMLEPLLSANPLDSAKTMAQIDKVADARANLEKANAKMLLGIRGVLTPEQWTKLHDAHGRDRFEGPGPQGGPGGPGGGPDRGPRGGMDNLAAPDSAQ
jgi:Spy/CpxP family protein refolding chaperone